MSSTISKYDPIEGAIWKQGEALQLDFMTSLLEFLTKQSLPFWMKSKRLENGDYIAFSLILRNRIISLTANLFRSIIATTPEDLLPTVYLIINQVAPTFEGLELGIGDGIIIKAIQEATGKSSYPLLPASIAVLPSSRS